MRWETKDDKELWVLVVGDYSVPFFCQRGEIDGNGEVLWSIRPSVFLGPITRVIDPLLEPMCISREGEFRLMADEKFRAHFEKCNGITPGYYLKTPETTGRKEVSIDLDAKLISAEAAATVKMDFPDWVHEKTGLLTRKELGLVWLSMCQEMPRFLLTKNSPIDMGWCRIFGLPYRGNWKQILLTKFPRIWRWLKNKSEWNKLEIGPFITESSSAELIGMHKYGKNWIIAWTPEIQPTKIWHEYTTMVEQTAFGSLSPRAYLARVGNLFNSNWKNLVSVFRSYVESTTLPCGDIAFATSPANRRLTAYTPEGSPAPVPLPNPPAAWVSDPCDDGIYPPGWGKARKGEAAYVSEVPVVSLYADERKDNGDMREDGGSDKRW